MGAKARKPLTEVEHGTDAEGYPQIVVRAWIPISAEDAAKIEADMERFTRPLEADLSEALYRRDQSERLRQGTHTEHAP